MRFHVTLTCLLLAIGANNFTAAKAQVNIKDSLILVDLYRSTNGVKWYNQYNWLTKSPMAKWGGILIKDNRVAFINLSGNNLRGHLPFSLGGLTKLYSLDLSSNRIGGSIPAFVGNLKSLTHLYLSRDHLSGAIPSSIGNLVNLHVLSLPFNKLSGELPVTIGNLINLEELYLYYNQLSGTLPSAIGNLVKLKNLWLERNKLNGKLPASIGKLTNLVNLYLNINQLSSLPPEIGSLKSLQYLDVSHNQLNNTLPSSISNLANLTVLDLSYNNLSGAIPSFLGNFKSIYALYLNHNHFSGSIPHSFSKLNIINLYLNNNQLSEYDNPDYKFTPQHLSNFKVNSNLFTFNGLEYVAQLDCYTLYAPQATISIHQHNNTLSLYAGGTLSNNTYKWFKIGEGNITIKGDSTFTPPTSGKYYATVTNKIAKQLTLYSDTIEFTTNNLIADNRLPADVNNIKQHMLVYPNPATNIIHIQTTGTAIITLTNSDGKVLLTKSITNSDVINISGFANDIYYIQNKTAGEKEKIVIMH